MARPPRRGSGKVVAIPETPSEELSWIETTLRPSSRYRLWCSLAGHRELGMEAKLRTTDYPRSRFSRAVFALNAAAIARSWGDPIGGSAPIWRPNSIPFE